MSTTQVIATMNGESSITLADLHKQAIIELNGYSDSARLDVDLILCHSLNINRTALFTQDDRQIDAVQARQIESLIAQRKTGYPLAYIIGRRHFWDLELEVNDSTLIPRPETELLVETALMHADNPQTICVLDLGTGSGAIAIAIANSRRHWTVMACDQSEAALDVARRNADRYNLDNIHFVHSDWFDKIERKNTFDLIVSNPPYIAQDDPHLQQGDVQFEPLTALCSGADGLDDIRRLLPTAHSYLKHNGWLWLEHGYNQSEQVYDLFVQDDYVNITQKKDLAGHIRITGGRNNSDGHE